MSLKRTALFEEHVKLGGRLIDFGGWELPVQYTGVMDEHLACRSAAGLFDVSHMGEIHVEGTGAADFLDYLVSQTSSKLAEGQAQYAVLLRDDGGIVDDLVIYRRTKKKFLVVVNASNTEKDYAWIESIAVRFRKANPSIEFTLSNQSANYTQIAIQGVKAAEIVQKLTSTPLAPVKTYWFAEGMFKATDGGEPIKTIFARTGYTGEDGFELYVPWSEGPRVWRSLMEIGAPMGLKACGLGARDTLRLEMKYPLYGHELTDETNPLEAGLSWVVKMAKDRFVGKDSLKRIQEAGLERALVGLKLLDRGIPRQGYKVWNHEGTEEIGELTSGTQSPSLKQAIGIAYVQKPFGEIGTQVLVDIRGTKVAAEIVATPFYKRPY